MKSFHLPFTHKKKHKKPVSSGKSANKLLGERTPFSVREAYRSARTNLMFLPAQEETSSCRKLVITSPHASAGKSLNCANLAITLSENGHRVLLIDCDMRKPNQNKTFDLPREHGLSEYLAGIDKHMTMHTVKYEGLSVMTSGTIPPNPTELLSSNAMVEMVRLLENQFDYILFDSTPVNLVADALVLSSIVDGYLLVVRNDDTDRVELDETIAHIKQVNGHIFGFLLNDVNPKSGNYSRYGRYGRYGKYARYGRYYKYRRYGYKYGRKYGYKYGDGYNYGDGYYGKNGYGYGEKDGYGYGYGEKDAYGYGYAEKDAYGYGYGYGESHRKHSKKKSASKEHMNTGGGQSTPTVTEENQTKGSKSPEKR